MACIVEPQELILEQTMFLFVFESSMEWRFCFLKKSDFYKNYNKICKILIFFRQICLKKVGLKFFFHIFLDVILFKI